MNRKNRRQPMPALVLLGLILTLLIPGIIMARSNTATRPEDKVEALVFEQLTAESETDFFVWMTEKADLSPAQQLGTKEEKGHFVYNALVETAERTQAELRAYLDEQRVPYEAFYIANKIYVRSGDLEAVLSIAAREDVARITANHQFQLQEPFIEPAPPAWIEAVIEPNITFVNADDVWALGHTGDGIVLAGNDTGLDWDHPALIEQYRGWDGSTADHNYNWWDATGTYPLVPDDGHGHGTHTTGTMVGDDGGTNQIGMAPTSETIHCKNMTDGGSGSDLTFTTCFEWDLAPWDLTGSNPNPSLAPHAINNSWGYFGGNQPQFIDEIDALRAAGIIVEVSAGNEGPGCATLRSPGDYRQSLTTGSIQHSGGVLPGTITGFSSRGPSDIHGGDFIPDIMAPGQNINSSLPGGGYSGPTWSGTSMSGPHVVGLIGLMWSASPGLTGLVTETEQIIIDTAVPLTGQNGSNCGGDYTDGPNNDWGHGTIDALAAVEEAIIQGGPFRLEADPDSVSICVPDDAVYTIDVLLNVPSFTDPIDLDAIGEPPGTTVNFVPDNLPAPFTSVLTIGNTGAAAVGSYSIDVVGVAPTATQTTTVGLNVFDAVPGAISLVSPADGATNVELTPLFEWTVATQGGDYYLEVAEDMGFSTIVYTATVSATSHEAQTPLVPVTTYYWRVTPSNPCGDGSTSAIFSFTTRDIPPILLVDDDDNAPDVQATYTDALDNLGALYDIWDTGGSDNEPTAVDLAPYEMVIWFTGVSFGGTAGPGSAGEGALASWLDDGGCFFISSQDYLFDRGLTPFIDSYLGVSNFISDVGQTQVTGAGSVYSGLGPYSLVYPFTNYSDLISPDGDAELAFSGSAGDAAVDKDSGVYRTTFWGFPFEALPDATSRQETMQATLNWCGGLGETGTLAGTVTDQDSGQGIGGATVSAAGPGNFSTQTDANGDYDLTLPVGTYDVTASAPDYEPETVNGVVIITGTTTTQDFALSGSHLSYSPASIEESMEFGDVVSNTVTISVTGPLPVDWSVSIQETGGPAGADPLAPLAGRSFEYSPAAPVGPLSVRSEDGVKALEDGLLGPEAWTEGASYPGTIVRYAHAQCDDQPDSFYVIAGVDNGSIVNVAYRYDADTDTWNTLAPLPTGQEGPSAVCYEGHIYVAGGGGTTQFFIYDIAADSWAAAPALPRGVWGAAMGAHDGKVYLIGGDSDFFFGGTSNEVNIYDIAAGAWTGTGTPMPEAAVTAGSVQLGEYVYVVGGWGDLSPGSNVDATQRYNMATDSWETGPTFTTGRADFALAATQQNLYAIGGDANGGGAFDASTVVEALDHTAWPGGSWSDVGDPLPAARTANNAGFCTSAVAGGEVWSVGGLDTGFIFHGTNQYRPAEACFTAGAGWVYAVPTSGTIPPNDTTTIEVVFDASSLFQVGDYTAELKFSGSFVNTVPTMPLTMHLSCPTCGFLEGAITDSQTGDPVSADVHVTGPGGFDVTISGETYSLAVQPGTYDLEVTASGYLSQTATANVQAGMTTTVDFALDPAVAILDYSPPAVEEFMEIGDVVTNTVTVTNDGFVDLEFNVNIGNYGGPGVILVPAGADPLAPLAGRSFEYSPAAPVGPLSVRSEEGMKALEDGLLGPEAWTEGASYPGTIVRYAHAQCDDQPDSFYVIAGVDNGSIVNVAYRYDADTDTWNTLAPLPTGQEGPSAACYEGHIYVAGGGGTTQFFIYDIAADSWAAAPALPRGVWGAAMGAHDGKVYLIGGDNDFFGGGTSNEVNIYDIAAGAWTGNGTPMPEAAVTAGSVQLGEYVYVVGGWGDLSPGSNVDATQRYNMATDSWEVGPTFTTGRADFALAGTQQNLYAIGGDANGGGFFDASTVVESLDHTAWPGGSWSDVGDPLPAARTANNAGFCTSAVAGGEVWSVGGLDTSFIFHGTNQYRPAEACFSGGVTDWAYAVPDGGTVPPMSSATFDLVFDARSLFQVGNYTAELSFSGNFVNSVPSMPLTMHLSCPTCGFLEGDITDAISGDPLPADIHVTGPGGFEVNLSGDSYSLAVQPGDYDFTVSANGYLSQTATVQAIAGMTTTTDFALVPIFSELAYSPQTFEVTVQLGDVVMETMTISNTGTVAFDFTLTDVETGNPFRPAGPAVECPPDSFGYTCTDSTEPDGLVTYNFEDISGSGTSVFLSDDQTSGPIPVGFSFNYYGTDYTNVHISSNGFLTVLPGQYNGCCTGMPLPTPGDPDGVIAGWWEDLNPSSGGTIHYQTLGTAPQRYMIVQFTNVPHYPSGLDTTFQYKLFETSNNIEVHYSGAPSDGGTHSAGIENQSGSVGLQYYLGTSPLSTPLAVCYLYPGQFACGSGGEDAAWLTESPDNGTVDAGSSLDVDIIFDTTMITQTGTYTANIYFSGTFGNSVPPAVAVMHVTDFTPVYGVEISGDAAAEGAPGTTVSYSVSVTNTGNVTDTFDLTLSGNSWTATLSDTSVTLGPGESATVTVEVEIPAGAGDGEMDTVTVTATSAGDPGVSASANLTTTAVVEEYIMYMPIMLKQP